MAVAGGTARIWDALEREPLSEPFEHEGPIDRVAFSPDGNTVAAVSQDDTARLWDVRMRLPTPVSWPLPGQAREVRFSADGARVALAAGNSAQIYDPQTGAPLTPSMAHSSVVNSVSISPDGRVLSTTSEDKTVKLWDTTSGLAFGEPLVHDGTTWTADFSADGRWLATSSRDRLLRIFEVQTHRLTNSFQHPGEVIGAEFSPDGTTVLTADHCRRQSRQEAIAPAGYGTELGRRLHWEAVRRGAGRAKQILVLGPYFLTVPRVCC